MTQGVRAYAESQIGVYKSLLRRFTSLWETPPGRRSRLPALMAPAEDDSRIDESLMSELLLGVAQGEEDGEEVA